MEATMMIEPLVVLLAIIALAAIWAVKKAPLTFTECNLSKLASSVSVKDRFLFVPAHATHMSSDPPVSCKKVEKAFSRLDTELTSTLKYQVFTEYVVLMSWNSGAGSIRSSTTTFAPASARPCAKERPQPRAPPVTTAVRSLSENCGSDQLEHRSIRDLFIPFLAWYLRLICV
jgi:hypothetical protein